MNAVVLAAGSVLQFAFANRILSSVGVTRGLLLARGKRTPLAPEAALNEAGKKVHYDTLRASVITGVSASVIAFASGRGLPVSTTYVAFAAVLGTGLSDRVFARGDAESKIGRAIWVITWWEDKTLRL